MFERAGNRFILPISGSKCISVENLDLAGDMPDKSMTSLSLWILMRQNSQKWA